MDATDYETAAAEETLAEAGSRGILRKTLYTALAAMLVGGIWVRFNDPIAKIAPALAAPAAGIAEQLKDTSRVRGLVELPVLSAAAATEALAAMGLPPTDLAALKGAIERGELRLVQMPLFDAGPTGASGPGRAVQVSATGYTRVVQLSREPRTLTLPIARIGTVSFRTVSGDGVAIGALTLSGPVQLPPLASGQVLSVGVVAQ